MFKEDHKEGQWVHSTKRGGYVNGLMHGKWIKLYTNGIRAIEGTYNMGVKDGYFVYRYYSGMVRKEGAFEKGLEKGLWFEYSTSGITVHTINYN